MGEMPGDVGSERPSVPSEADVCGYIAEICGELAAMAAAARLGFLAYVLGMARHEAEQLARLRRGGRASASAKARA